MLTGRIFTSSCLHLWSRLLASLVSFRFVLEQWVNQSSYIHPCLQFTLIYEQRITQSNLRLICHLSLRCTGKVFSRYKQPPQPLQHLCCCCCCCCSFWACVVENSGGGKGEEMSLAASPAVCSSHSRGGYYTLPSLSGVIASASTPEDVVSLTAITHCHSSSLRGSMQWHPPHAPLHGWEVVVLLWAETPSGDRRLFGSRIKLDVCWIEMLSLAWNSGAMGD